MKLSLKVLFLIFFFYPSMTMGVTVNGLYEAEVHIENTSPENRLPAIRTALGLVLIKLTGNRFAPADDALQPVLRRAESYLQEFSYPQDSVMRVRFNEPTLTNDLRDLGIAVWGNERPSTLLWVVTGGMNQQEILGLDGDPEILSIIEQRVKRRGIVMVYPLLDLTDSMSLHPSDISGGFLQAIIDASRRYPADSILAGGVDSPAPGIWTAHWIAYINGESFTWDAQGDIPAMVIDEGIDGLADFLAARFIQTEITEQREVSISIININNVDQYAQALKYLESLSFVTRVNVKSAVNGEIIFNLQSHGGCPALSKAINIGRRLEPLAGADCERYRLLPEP